MARVNVYLPDDLAAEARAADLNVSKLTQEAVRAALAGARTNAWLDEVRSRPPTGVTAAAVDEAIRAAKDELEGLD